VICVKLFTKQTLDTFADCRNTEQQNIQKCVQKQQTYKKWTFSPVASPHMCTVCAIKLKKYEATSKIKAIKHKEREYVETE